MHYRLYRPSDFPQLYAIEQLCFQPPLRFPRRYMSRLVSNPNSATWIAESAPAESTPTESMPAESTPVASTIAASTPAEEDSTMAAFAVAGWTREWTRESDRTIAYIETLEVAPAYRQQGIATELLRRIEGSAAAAGAQLLWLHVAEENAAAIRLYQSRGYQLQGREENYYDAGVHALLFAKQPDTSPIP